WSSDVCSSDLDGRRDRARQEARAAVRGVARGRVWTLGDLLRRPVQAGAEGTGADPRGEARAGGTGGAEEISRRGEGNDGRGEALTAAPVSSCGVRRAACDGLQIIPIQPRDEVDRDLFGTGRHALPMVGARPEPLR